MKKKAQLDIALRKNRGSRILGPWVAKFVEASGIKISSNNFLTLEKTEALKQSFFEKIKIDKNIVHKSWPVDRLKEIMSLIGDLTISYHDVSVVLFSSVDQYIGAICLKVSEIFPNLEAIWNVIGEDLSVTTEDLKSGICLESNFYTETGEYRKDGVFKSSTWGSFVF